MSTTEQIIEAVDLRRVFDTKEAAAGISFSVQHCEIFGPLGPNGAGKSTTIRRSLFLVVPGTDERRSHDRGYQCYSNCAFDSIWTHKSILSMCR